MPAAANNFRVDPGGVLRAIEWLKHARSHSATGALEYLDQLRSSGAILGCYRRMFPALWVASTAPTSGWDERFPSHSPREGEFLKIVASRYFHMPEDMGWGDDEQHYDTIPVTPMQGDAWCCGDFEFNELRACYYVSLSLFGSADFWESCAERYHLDADKYHPAARIDFERFEELCRAERDALRHLPLAIRLMHYDTGNVWLDTSFCMPPPNYRWTVANVMALARQFKEARGALERMDELDRYLDNNPTEGVTRSLELWNRSAGSKKEDGSSNAGEGQDA